MTTRSIIVGSGPGTLELPLGVITDGQALVRDGDEILGVDTSEFSGPATQIEDESGDVLDVGEIGFNSYLYRGGGTDVYGQTADEVARQAWQYQLTPTLVTGAAYDWNTTAPHIAVTHPDAACDVSLPVEADVTNWPPNSPPRRVSKMNTSANGINLLVTGNCTINGGGAGTDMSPIPDSNAAVGVAALGQSVLVFRETATAYWVLGAA